MARAALGRWPDASCALPFPFSAPTVPGGRRGAAGRRAGADYDTAWARRYPARLARAAIVEAVARPAVAALARPERHGLDRLTLLAEAGGRSSSPPTTTATSTRRCWSRRSPSRGGTSCSWARRPTTSSGRRPPAPCRPWRSAPSRSSGPRWAGGRPTGPRPCSTTAGRCSSSPRAGAAPTGWGQPFRGGAAYLAVRCGVPVVPVHIDGTGRILRKGRKLPKPATARVTFGPPLFPGPGDDSRRFGPHRACRRRPGRRGHHRLVVGPAAGARRRVTGAGRAGRTRVAPGLGARRPRPEAHPAAPPLARALAAGRGDRPPPCRLERARPRLRP